MIVVLATLAGALIYTWLAGALDEAFRPFSDDTHAWIFLAVPTGVILGALSGLSFSERSNLSRLLIGIICIISAVVAVSMYAYFLQEDVTRYNLKYALSFSGPALVWAAALFARGAWLVVLWARSRKSLKNL